MRCRFLIYSKHLLKEPLSIEDGVGDPDWRLTICLFVAWVAMFLVVIRGVRSSGKVAYILALFPYVVMIILLIRGASLPGAGEGMRHFFEPQWGELLKPKVREWMNL
jgi:solute carrier family 6 amino acid transporter-like protein 5/7/9/14